jgi:hypothetical protein
MIPYCEGLEMIIELALLIAVVAAIGASVVKIYEWRQDVLYGPFLAKDGENRNRRQ